MSMMTMRGAPRSRRGEAIELKLILALTYPIFLVAALAGRLVPRRGAGPRPSVFREARLNADRTIHLAFMG
jgi:hypothetical protein